MSLSGSDAKFALGDKVALRAEPQKRGAVTGVAQRANGIEYEVIIDGVDQWVGESNLIAAQISSEPNWSASRNNFLSRIALAKMQHPLTDALYSYRSSRTQHEPYQFRPALKFLRSNQGGILIADEVGLGKTIEAAIIYLELKARMDISRVLVVCPSRLTSKWQDELQHRFEEAFDILNAEKLRRLFADYERFGTVLRFNCIVSFELLRRQELADQWEGLHIPLDMLIVDEAHYLRNSETRTYQMGVALASSADACVLLSATPLHLRNRDLFNLLNLISPEEYSDPNLFDKVLEPNLHINAAIRHVARLDGNSAYRALRKVERTSMKEQFVRNPFYREVCEQLRNGNGELARPKAVSIQRRLIELNTLSPIFSRTKKREVINAAIREPHTIRIELTPQERTLYNAVLGKTKRKLETTGSGALGFGAIMQERLAASCLPALVTSLRKTGKMESRGYDPEASAMDDVHVTADPSREIEAAARNLLSGDSKFARFEEILETAVRAHPGSKALVFSFFRDTLQYLETQLRQRGWKPLTIHGGVPTFERTRIIEQFRDDPQTRVLLSSEVGAEGLDFQFCDVLINYDLPWNPMQIEQRIGRLDRFGQKSSKIRIYNFHIADTIETRIFQRLYERIHLFETAIGDLEAILGDEISKLTLAALRPELSAQQQEQLANDAAVRILKRQQAEADLEEEKDQLLGQGTILDQQVDQAIESGQYVSQAEVQALVMSFLSENFPRSLYVADADEACATLELSSDLREFMTKCVEKNRLATRLSPTFRKALGGSQRLALTFDSELARTRPLLDFVTIRHPLAIAALDFAASSHGECIPGTSISLKGVPGERGDGFFFVYLIEVKSATPRTRLQPIVLLEDGRFAPNASQQLLKSFQVDMNCFAPVQEVDRPYSEYLEIANDYLNHFRASMEQDAAQRNEAVLASRTTAVRNSFDAKIVRTREIRDAATNDKIRAMRSGQIRNLESRKSMKLAELDQLRDVSVTSRLIVAGKITVN